MILLLAGTRDGRELAAQLTAAGYAVTVSVTSGYGRELAQHSAVRIQAAAMAQKELEAFIRQNAVGLLVDATHPYAARASRNAAAAAASAGIPCLRYERPASALPDYPKLTLVPDMAAAAALCAQPGRTVFLTVGSHSLPVFRSAAQGTDCRLIARVLPQPEVLADCLAAGFSPADIVAMQGPFSRELNQALFREFGADVVVTKNSGAVGGTDEKLAAAMDLGLELVVVGRPAPAPGEIFTSVSAVLEFVRRHVDR